MSFVMMLLGGAGRLLGAIWGFSRANPALAACGLLAALCWHFHAMDGKHIRQRDQARQEYALFKKAVEQKAAEALAAQIKINRDKEAEYVQDAKAADAVNGNLRALYAERMRARSGGGSSGVASGPAQGGDTGNASTAAPLPVSVRTMPESDWLKLPDLQAYAQTCWTWAQKLAASNGAPQ